MTSGEKLTSVERQQRYRDRRNIFADSADLKPLTLRGAAIAPGTRATAPTSVLLASSSACALFASLTTILFRGWRAPQPFGLSPSKRRRLTLLALPLIVSLGLAGPAAATFDVSAEESEPGASTQVPTPAPIDHDGVLALIRSTLLALDQANKTGNYTVLRDLGSPRFQLNTAARLSEIFASQRYNHMNLAAVAVLEPQLTVPPQIEANGLMRMAGFFPSVPMEINFDLVYAPVDRQQWRLSAISVSFRQAAPVAPPPSEPPPAVSSGDHPI